MRKLAIALLIVPFCSTGIVSAQSSVKVPMPKALVYKTKADYRNLVAVQLSEDRKTVTSYPDPSDVKNTGNGPLPLKLHKGYLLDRRGVSWNTAFIKLTYEQYSKLSVVPTPEQLFAMIVDKDPMTELYSCGPKNQANVKNLNSTIDAGKIKKKCIPVKKYKNMFK